ncbi:AtpZ/AtpI family protein [Haloflavibacter putidus]|uniref:AtpZ/AtpI family protein n=1 Tax=Haloflavibacter putidus TaxID=2576776 RepID=A0A507ZSL5_9FLAO|nr:AtpZ/AtpI family protein [Haloflavibacter putidus]TQD40786.1 AtpZ/AtpI family protein [Haloflavibacter putidus]
MNKQKKENKKNKLNKPVKNWTVFTSIAIQMAVAIAGGVFLGIWLDEKFPNKYAAFTIIFSLLGVFVGLYQVYSNLKNFS